MKTFAFAILSLSGCNWADYEVKEHRNREYTYTDTNYTCVKIRPLFFWNVVLKQCTTKEECNEFCVRMYDK